MFSYMYNTKNIILLALQKKIQNSFSIVKVYFIQKWTSRKKMKFQFEFSGLELRLFMDICVCISRAISRSLAGCYSFNIMGINYDYNTTVQHLHSDIKTSLDVPRSLTAQRHMCFALMLFI